MIWISVSGKPTKKNHSFSRRYIYIVFYILYIIFYILFYILYIVYYILYIIYYIYIIFIIYYIYFIVYIYIYIILIPLAIPTLKWGSRDPKSYQFYTDQSCSKMVGHISQEFELTKKTDQQERSVS